VVLTEKGQVLVTGPLENKIFMLGLLEMAKDAVLKFTPVPAGAPRILIPGNGLPGGM